MESWNSYIEINNLTTISINKEFLKKVCQEVLRDENRKNIELSVVLVGEAKIKELNKKYRKKNKVTDILSFQYDDNLAEIVICLSKIKKNAKKNNIIFEQELTKVLIHGLLHILGYDHEKSEEGAEKMGKKEKHYLLKT